MPPSPSPYVAIDGITVLVTARRKSKSRLLIDDDGLTHITRWRRRQYPWSEVEWIGAAGTAPADDLRRHWRARTIEIVLGALHLSTTGTDYSFGVSLMLRGVAFTRDVGLGTLTFNARQEVVDELSAILTRLPPSLPELRQYAHAQ